MRDNHGRERDQTWEQTRRTRYPRSGYPKRKRSPFSVKVQTVDGSIQWVPDKERSTDAYFNIRAKSFSGIGGEIEEKEDYVLEPDERVLVKVGFMMDLLPGWEAQIRTKHSMAVQSGLSVLDSPSTIDSGYKEEVAIILINNGEQDIKLNSGDEVAQMVVAKVPHVKLWHVAEINDPFKSNEEDEKYEE